MSIKYIYVPIRVKRATGKEMEWRGDVGSSSTTNFSEIE